MTNLRARRAFSGRGAKYPLMWFGIISLAIGSRCFRRCLCGRPPSFTRTMPDMQPEKMSIEMIKRMTAAISDLDCLDSLSTAA